LLVLDLANPRISGRSPGQAAQGFKPYATESVVTVGKLTVLDADVNASNRPAFHHAGQ
jgi:hypothetical protein